MKLRFIGGISDGLRSYSSNAPVYVQFSSFGRVYKYRLFFIGGGYAIYREYESYVPRLTHTERVTCSNKK